MGRDAERRGSPRTAFEEEAILFIADRRVRARATDISSSGMGLRVNESVSIGTFVRVNFVLTDPQAREIWHDADAMVVRQTGRVPDLLLGVGFVGLTPAIAQSLDEYVRNHRQAEARRKQAQLYATRFEQGKVTPASWSEQNARALTAQKKKPQPESQLQELFRKAVEELEGPKRPPRGR